MDILGHFVAIYPSLAGSTVLFLFLPLPLLDINSYTDMLQEPAQEPPPYSIQSLCCPLA